MEKYVLIADDNKSISDILSNYLKSEGFTPVIAFDGEEAIEKFEKHNPIIVLLDVMMPKLDGFEVCRIIRKKSVVPIIMITAKSEDSDKIMGLDNGADDYIIKPFSPGEIMARIRAILRRVDLPELKSSRIVSFEDLSINMDEYEVISYGSRITLTKKELDILYSMASSPGKVFSRDNLLDSIWGYDYYGDTRTVDTHIKRLRAKLGAREDGPWDIKTIWGVGYKFEVKNV